MEAIVIVFSGEYLPDHQSDVVNMITEAIRQHTTAEGIDALSVSIISNNDIAKILAAQSIKKENVKVPFDESIVEFCKNIITTVGDPANFSNESTYKVEFVKRILNDAELRKRNTDVLKYLITSGKIQPAYRNILNGYHLSNVPVYLKEINTILNLF